jgi:cytochrome c-type biogenesis protein CcmH
MGRAGAIRALVATALLVVAASVSPVLAVQPGEILSDQALETRARRISTEIRCLVCQNQSIDDSDAPLAHDLRVLVRDRLKAGDSDAAVRDFIVGRYGDFVLLRPPMNGRTLLLWFGPAAILLAAGLGLLLARRRNAPPAPAPLTADEEARLGAILQADEVPRRT